MDVITPEQFTTYIRPFSQPSHPELLRIMDEASKRQDVLPSIEMEVGRLLQLLVRISGSHSVLELGTCLGISTIFLALALPEKGKLTTIELLARVAQQAQDNFRRCGVEDKVETIVGNVLDIVPTLTGSYDLIFQDSGKQTYTPLLEDLVRLLAPGGLLIIDDTLFPAMVLPYRNIRTQKAIARFNMELLNHSKLDSFVLPLGHGLTIAQKKS